MLQKKEERKRIDRDLLELFINDYQPFSIVEDKGFKHFAKNIPGYSLPGRKTISSVMIPALYEKTIGDVKEIVERDVRSVCITTDCWTSSQTESYIAVTAHYKIKNLSLNAFSWSVEVSKSATPVQIYLKN